MAAQSQNNPHDDLVLEFVVVPLGHLLVREETVEVIVSVLDQDHGNHANALVDELIADIQAANPIDLTAPRSHEAAEYDRMEPTTAGYLLGLIRDRFLVGTISDWRECVALGSLAADIEGAI